MTTSNNYDDLDYCLNIYYDMVYRKTPEKNYMFKPISRKNIELIDLKKPSDFNGDFVLAENLEYIGYHNERFHFKRKSETGFPCDCSFGWYDGKNPSLMDRGILYNQGMMYMISELCCVEKFKHSLLQVMMFDVKYSQINDMIPMFKKYQEDNHLENIPADMPMYCLVTEHFFDMMTLREYLEKNAKNMTIHWKILFFQVLFALYKLSEKFRNFRHNRLNLDAIRLYIKKEGDNMTTYKVGSDTFSVPNKGFDIKLTDYDYSTTKDYLPNHSKKDPIDNPYYDVYYFFASLYK